LCIDYFDLTPFNFFLYGDILCLSSLNFLSLTHQLTSKVPVLIQLEQVIRNVQGDPKPVVEVHPSFFCEWQGEIYKCTGKRVPTGLELPGDRWLYTLKNLLGISVQEVQDSSQLSEPWIKINEI
jgi:hypothetical protein